MKVKINFKKYSRAFSNILERRMVKCNGNFNVYFRCVTNNFAMTVGTGHGVLVTVIRRPHITDANCVPISSG